MPTPSNIAAGSLDMTLRALLTHMMEKRLNHVVLMFPEAPVQISVTVASVEKTREITQKIERILKP
jgi:DNA-binding TFAR19-related protein (PDSD5 family)